MPNRTHDPKKVLRFIKRYKKKYGGSTPSLTEISESCDIPAKSNVRYILDELERQGKIKLEYYRRRIYIPGEQYTVPK